MVLVAGQGGATREGLLAVGVWALVGPLSRVDAAMASQRTRVTERLCNVSLRMQDMRRKEHTFPHRSHM
jgi:hypothetical protein